jgi:GT2 family glycosyltransferase
VIVAARDAARTLPACLASLVALDYPDFDVVVSDDGSRDETAAIARSFGVRVIDGGGRGPSAARNLAVAASTSAVVAFTDADCEVPPHWLRALAGGLVRSGAASVGGRQRNVFDRDWPQRHGDTEGGSNERRVTSNESEALDAFFSLASVVAEYTRSEAAEREVDHNASCNSAYRRDAFVEVGGFAEGLWPGEDVDLDYRLRQRGYRCYYVPDAVVVHHRPSDPQWFRRMMRRYGRTQRELVRRHGHFRALHWMPPALLVLALAQLLWLPGRTRAAAACFDAALAATCITLLARHVPRRLWGPVLRYATLALVEWNRGFAEGLDAA